MKAGNHNLPILILIFILITNYAFSEQKINLKDLQPTFEEESETVENNILEDNTIKSKAKKNWYFLIDYKTNIYIKKEIHPK